MRKTVTIRDGWVQASTRELTGINDTLAATFPGYAFILDEDFNIAQGLIRIAGVGKIVRRGKMPPSASDLIAQSKKNLKRLRRFGLALMVSCLQTA